MQYWLKESRLIIDMSGDDRSKSETTDNLGSGSKAARIRTSFIKHTQDELKHEIHELNELAAELADEYEVTAGLKGSIGDRSNHSNFSHQNSVKILIEFRKIHQTFQKISEIWEILNIF